ncbi:MAG: 50S ribosomal protein L28 [Planctomycetales bacterium 4484_113]|nr:MAG: 50S ribosomal protein L28 [Planctomycetales bacterium 4484_113]
MSRRCEITGKGPRKGYRVSHSQRHTKHRWLPNLRTITITDEKGRRRKVKLSIRALRTMSKSPKLRRVRGPQ